MNEIRAISADKYEEYLSVTYEQRISWILSGGTTREPSPDPVDNHRIRGVVCPILRGRSVTPVKDKHNPDECLDAYEEYLEIVSSLPQKHIRIYTDGSHSPHDGKTGYGVRIIEREYKNSQIIYSAAIGLGSETINVSELTAIEHALRWLYSTYDNLKPYPIHIFTDSKYALNACCSSQIRRTNFHIIQEIHNYSYKFKYFYRSCQVSIHYVPSHIENTGKGSTHTGNYYVDKLANEGRLKSSPQDKHSYLEIVREKILDATIRLIDKIDSRIIDFETPNGPSAISVDDFSGNADANRDLTNSKVS